MRPIIALIFVSLLAITRNARSEEPASEIPSDLILARFALANNGNALLATVTVADHDYSFVVDTGSTTTCFDTSFPLVLPVGVQTAGGAEGEVEVKLFRPPDAKVGGVPLAPLDAVGAADLKLLREVSGQYIRGMLGMDFLGRYVVHIDMERGEVLLLKSAPKRAGVALPVSYEPGTVPFVGAEIAPGESIRFTVDTGASAEISGSLGIVETGSLVRKGRLCEIAKMQRVSLSGKKTRLLLQGDALRIGEFAIQSPIFSESYGPMPNKLGLGFWSRFVATFDFPKRTVYLRKTATFSRPDRLNATGLNLWNRRGSIEVQSVDRESAASQAGLKSGDVFVELDGLNADKTNLINLRNALCKDGELKCVVRRNSQVLRLIIGHAR